MTNVRTTVITLLLIVITLPTLEAAKKHKTDWYMNDVPQAAVPWMKNPPRIDGSIDGKEWREAVSFTGFMAPHGQHRQPYVLPETMQAWAWIGYDDKMVYIGLESMMPPGGENASQRLKKVLHKYRRQGLQSLVTAHDAADKIEGEDHWELRIINGDRGPLKRFGTKYIFKVNALGVYSDQMVLPKHEGMNRHKAGIEWESGAAVKAQIGKTKWSVEMAIPIEAFAEPDRPAVGKSWRIMLARGRSYESYDTSRAEWNATKSFFMESQGGLLLFDKQIPAFHLESLGPLRMADTLSAQYALFNPTKQPQTVTVRIAAESIDQVLHEEKQTMTLAANEERRFQGKPYLMNLPDDVSARIVIGVSTARDHLYSASIQTKKMSVPEYRTFVVPPTNLWPFESPMMDQWQLRLANYPYFKSMDVWANAGFAYLPGAFRKAIACRLELLNEKTDATVRSQTIALDADKLTGHVHWENLELPEGSYLLKGQLLDKADGPLGRPVVQQFVRKKFAWEHNKLGVSDQVFPPFRAIKTDKAQQTMSPWGRIYSVGPCGLPGAITATGETDTPGQVICRATQLTAVINGKKVTFSGPGKISDTKPGSVCFTGQGEAGPLKVTASSELKYEGWLEVNLVVSPAKPVKIDALELQIPFGDYPDCMFYTRSRAGDYSGALPQKAGPIWNNLSTNNRTRAKANIFTPVIAIGNGDTCLWWFADTDKSWRQDYAKPSQFVSRDEDGVNLSIQLINHPVTLDKPLRFTYAVQAFPASPKPTDYRRLMWGGQKRVHDTGGYGYWGNGIDSITPGSDEAFSKLNKAIDQWSKRNTSDAPTPFPPIVLYNSGEFLGQGMEEFDTFSGEWAGQTPAPVNAEYIDSDVHTRVKFQRNLQQDWRSQPKRLGPTKADLTQSCVDARIWHYYQNMNKLGVSGYWFDNASVWPGTNPSTERAYVTKTGTLRPCYPVLARHQLFRRLFVIYKQAGKEPFFIVNGHTSFCFSPWRWHSEANAYVYSYMGTIFDTLEKQHDFDIISRITGTDTVRHDPIGRHRALIRLKPMVGAYRSNVRDNVKGSRSVIGMALLHDFGVEGGVEEKTLEKVKSILDAFGFFKPAITYLPYWRNREYLTLSPPTLKAALYSNPESRTLLAVIVNPTKNDLEAHVNFSLKGLKIRQAAMVDGESKARLGNVKGSTGHCRITIPKRDFRLIVIE